MSITRRQAVGGAVLASAMAVVGASSTGGAVSPSVSGTVPAKPFAPVLGPRSRVMVVNDLSGDVDGLFSTAHALLSPGIEVRGIVGTTTGAIAETARRSVEIAAEMIQVMGLAGKVRVYEGAQARLTDATPHRSLGTQAIIDEALRTDTKLPLYVTVGGGLTEVASALLLEPRIADKFTLVWIGGNPYPRGNGDEYNYKIDPIAVRTVFNDFQVPIWQIPSDAYGLCQVSNTELQVNVAPHGAIGAWLYAKLVDANRHYAGLGMNTGESWTLGDSPLVLLTALTTWYPGPVGRLKFERTGSSPYEEMIAPHITADGGYEPRDQGRRIRVYKSLDTRMMFDDFFAKLRINYG